MPSTLAEAMIRLLASSSNDSLVALGEILHNGPHTLGKLWTNQLPQQSRKDLDATNALLPGIEAQFREVFQHEQAQLPTIVDPELLEGTTVKFPRSLVRLAGYCNTQPLSYPWQVTYMRCSMPKLQGLATSMHGD